jgi:hypothetical protein
MILGVEQRPAFSLSNGHQSSLGRSSTGCMDWEWIRVDTYGLFGSDDVSYVAECFKWSGLDNAYHGG